jgi:hypothetical protein
VITHTDGNSYIVGQSFVMPREGEPWKIEKKFLLLLRTSVQKSKVLGFIVYGKFQPFCK